MGTTLIRLFILATIVFLFINAQALGLTYDTEHEEYELIQVKLHTSQYSSSGGIYVLGIGAAGGSNGESDVYKFYTKDSTGAIRIQQVDYEYVTFYEIKGKPYCIRNGRGGIFIVRWDLYIPKGSISENIDINIK